MSTRDSYSVASDALPTSVLRHPARMDHRAVRFLVRPAAQIGVVVVGVEAAESTFAAIAEDLRFQP